MCVENEFIPYEEALIFEELGFDEPCLGAYYHAGKRLHIAEYVNHGEYSVLAPLWSQAFNWFREKYNIHYTISYECSQQDHTWGYNWNLYNYTGLLDNYITSHPDAPAGEWVYDTHNQAILACLKEIIKILKDNMTF